MGSNSEEKICVQTRTAFAKREAIVYNFVGNL